ncbi:FadR family transcriptional regulator [Pseudomonas sp. 13B_2.1_Bac1]|jgi:DNA-binding FadR family transcriptional regulator|uniref:FadR/GntR family transcriptional regulator n=1 Tax=unclassified Pseudomonas TaxID=196821 RepID=UPI000D0EA44F|nr:MULTISPECIES: FadR/GntR family transcriptional regulator [unclassified Pseudomonas]AYF46988.1 FadR family transcriptional regulator [Pseudomonas fluorescens]MBK5475348.1 FadR family transcriptional regulator [Pseudomonas sp. TH21]MBS7841529.1 FadR family transcriptional regulator [Pseudomonas fluorescens]MCU1782580.1 FadR family transcriptional regulator [Pseudomonas sp. 13B_2.1_Bac1]QTV18935.1 FadR family transcriptional regulator [Pseudomonas fluorescens]
MTDIAPLIKRSLVDQALEQLRQRITQGTWAIGERLPTEPELSAELGISRNTVREAMRVLAFSGLIEIRQGDGSYLRSMTDPLGAMRALSHCTLEQAQETRQILEVEAIGLAALRRTEDDLHGLREALQQSAVLYHGDLEAYISADLVFHKRLVDAAHNPALSELYQYFSAIVGAQLRQTLNISPRRQAVFDLHIALLDAVEHQDPERAKSLCRQLINEP